MQRNVKSADADKTYNCRIYFIVDKIILQAVHFTGSSKGNLWELPKVNSTVEVKVGVTEGNL